MKIVFLFERKIIPEEGGVERVTLLLSRELQRRGHQVRFLSVGPRAWNTKESNCEFLQDYIPGESEDKLQKVSNYFNEVKPEVIIIQGCEKHVTSIFEAIPAGIKKMMVYHNQPYPFLGQERFVKSLTPWNSLDFKGRLMKGLAMTFPHLFRVLDMKRKRNYFKKIISGVDRFVLLSERFKSRLMNNTPGLDNEKIIAINNPNTFEITDEDFSSRKEKMVLFVGRLSNTQKNVTGFLKVWKMFHDRFPDWNAVILGDGEDREYIKAYAKRLGVKNLVFAGVRKDVGEFYARSRILCMTSSYEGWGMVLGEALSYGTVPVLYNSYEATADLIDSGVNGFLIPPYDKKKMVERMCELAASPDLCRKMTVAGKYKIQDFSVENIVDQWEKTLRLEGKNAQ